MNAKTQRPGVCNAMETLLVHEKIADRFLPKLLTKLDSEDVVISLFSAGVASASTT